MQKEFTSLRNRAALFASSLDPSSAFVFSAFLILAIAYLRFTVTHYFPIPFWDDSQFIPYATGDRPVDLAWLWTPFNEHRMPLVRLFYVALDRMSGLDGRVTGLPQVVFLTVTSALLLYALRRVNSKTQYTDAVIPLALLGTGQMAAYQYSIPTCAVCMIAVLFVLPDARIRLLSTLLGPAILMVCLCGFNGFILGLAISLMLLWTALRSWRSGRRAEAGFAFGCAAILLLCAIAVLGEYRTRTSPYARPFSFSQGIAEGLKAAALCFGPAGADLWPYSAILAIAFVVAGLSILLYRSASNRSFPAAGLTLILAGFGGLALGIGMGRTTLGPGSGFAPRYALLFAPVPIVVMFAFDRFTALPVRDLARMTLFAILCFMYWPNSRVSLSELEYRVADGHKLEEEVRQGVPIQQLAEEFGPGWMFSANNFAEKMNMLAKARMAVYRDGRPLPGHHQGATSPDELSSLTQSAASTPNYIDSINGLRKLGPGTVHLPRSAVLAVAGWAVDATAGQPASRVYLDVDGKRYPAEYGLTRPDVARSLKNPAYAHCGFTAKLPGTLNDGEHRLQLDIVNAQGSAYYAGMKISFDFVSYNAASR